MRVIIDKLPPASEKIERQVLAVLFKYESESKGSSRANDITVGDFYFELHQQIFTALHQQRKRGREVTVDTVLLQMIEENPQGPVETYGISKYLGEEIRNLNVPASEEDHIFKSFERLHRLRKIIQFATDLLANTYDQTENVDLKSFMQPYFDAFDKIAAEANISLWIPPR